MNETLVGNQNISSFRNFNKSELSQILTPTKLKHSDNLKGSYYDFESIEIKKFPDLKINTNLEFMNDVKSLSPL